MPHCSHARGCSAMLRALQTRQQTRTGCPWGDWDRDDGGGSTAASERLTNAGFSTFHRKQAGGRGKKPGFTISDGIGLIPLFRNSEFRPPHLRSAGSPNARVSARNVALRFGGRSSARTALPTFSFSLVSLAVARFVVFRCLACGVVSLLCDSGSLSLLLPQRTALLGSALCAVSVLRRLVPVQVPRGQINLHSTGGRAPLGRVGLSASSSPDPPSRTIAAVGSILQLSRTWRRARNAQRAVLSDRAEQTSKRSADSNPVSCRAPASCRCNWCTHRIRAVDAAETSAEDQPQSALRSVTARSLVGALSSLPRMLTDVPRCSCVLCRLWPLRLLRSFHRISPHSPPLFPFSSFLPCRLPSLASHLRLA